MPRTIKVAVVGSGLAGLTAAYLLSNAPSSSDVEFEVHLFEKSSSLGMDAHSVSVALGDAGDRRVDVPMRSFQGGYYPQLIALYRHLGVQFRQTDFSYSFSLLSHAKSIEKHARRHITTTLIYNGASGLRGLGVLSSMKQKAEHEPMAVRMASQAFLWAAFALTTLSLLWNYLRLVILSAPLMRSVDVSRITFRDWSQTTLPQGPFARWLHLDDSWRDFCDMILVPLFSAVCTAPEQDILEHPVEELLDYIWLTLFTHHYVVSKGIQDVVSRLSVSVKHIHLASPIFAINPDADDPSLISIECAAGKTFAGFSHLVLATQANSAAKLLESYQSSLLPKTPLHTQVTQQISCLRRFKYCDTVVINHTDPTLLPDDPQDHRDLNLITAAVPEERAQDENCLPTSYTMATHILGPIYQTTDPIVPPRAASILSVARLERAVLTLDAKRALPALGALQGPRVWLCGSYAHGGIPLLEGCVVSARTVVERGVLASEGVRVTRDPW